MNTEFRPTMKLRHARNFYHKSTSTYEFIGIEQWWEEGCLVRSNERCFLWLPTNPPKGEWRLIDMGEISK